MSDSFTPRSVKRLDIIRDSKPSLLPLFQKVYGGKAAILEMVEATCLDCVGLDKQAVTDCVDRCCPLWHCRPYRNQG